MSDEPIYTGWLQTQLSGNIEQARGYLREGRRVLGAMLTAHGVPQRMADGEPGGFFKKVRELPDGTVITAITNNGRHLVRIDAPHRQPIQKAEGEHHSATSPHHSGRVEAQTEVPFEPAVPPIPTHPTREWEDEEEEKKKPTTDYMWVGIRSTNPDVPWYALNAFIVEPDSGPPWDEDKNPVRGVVGTSAVWHGKRLVLNEESDTSYTLSTEFPFIEAADVRDAIQTNYDDYVATDGAQLNIIPGTHHLRVLINGDGDGEFEASANGLRCFASNETLQGQADITRWLPYDPLAHDQSGGDPRDYPDQQVRDYGDRHIRDSHPIAPCLWDIVYVADPDESAGEYPCETRPHVLRAREALEKAGMRNILLPGEYLLGIHIVDDAPALRSTRAGEVIPMYAGEDLGYRSATSDYDDYMKPVDTTLNTQVAIEVRLGRGADATTLTFHTAVASADDRDYSYLPYGFGTWDPCSQEYGPNPLGPNWAPQWLAINALGGSARWVDPGEADLLPIFGGGQYGNPDDHRRPLDIYLFIYGPSQPSQENYAEYMASALFAVMEAASAGVYGDVLMREVSEAGLRGLLGGVSKSLIWRFNPMSMSLQPVPLISELEDYPYGEQNPDTPEAFMSPYIEPMFWYYPYKIIARDQCRRSLGICITAIKDTYFFESDQAGYFADPPLTVECC
jgi:hypothetical protein